MNQSLDLEMAVKQIKRICDSEPHRFPFFFLVGAGISYPPVPLAPEIARTCKAIVRKREDNSEETEDTEAMKAYSDWFRRAYEQPIDRQRYLASLIKNKNISHANFRLAHLLSENKISKIVVTPNFDDFLSRALILFGENPVVCDHPEMVIRINPNDQDRIQIVHVHGTYPFYDCINLSGEIEKRAQTSSDTTSTMGALLDAILWDRSPIVIGYSGWENDTIMKALKRRLKRPLPYNLYWFCFRESNIDELPDWLKDDDNGNVFFVIQQAKQKSKNSEATTLRENPLNKSLATPLPTIAENLSGKEDDEATLPAVKVLDEINKAFETKIPALIDDPLNFFVEYLKRSLPLDEENPEEDKIYFFNKVIEQVEEARRIINEEKEKETPVESQLEDLRNGVRRSQYKEALEKAQTINYDQWTELPLVELLKIMESVRIGVADDQDAQHQANKLLIGIRDKLIKILEQKND